MIRTVDPCTPEIAMRPPLPAQHPPGPAAPGTTPAVPGCMAGRHRRAHLKAAHDGRSVSRVRVFEWLQAPGLTDPCPGPGCRSGKHHDERRHLMRRILCVILFALLAL